MASSSGSILGTDGGCSGISSSSAASNNVLISCFEQPSGRSTTATVNLVVGGIVVRTAADQNSLRRPSVRSSRALDFVECRRTPGVVGVHRDRRQHGQLGRVDVVQLTFDDQLMG